MVGSGTELEVAKSAAASFQQQYLLSVVCHIAYVFACFGVVNDRSARYVDIYILAVCAVAFVPAAVSAVLGENVPLVSKVQQSPVVVVAAQVYAAAFASVASVGASVRLVFGVAQVH